MPLDLFETLNRILPAVDPDPQLASISNDGDVLSEFIYNTTLACGEEGNDC